MTRTEMITTLEAALPGLETAQYDTVYETREEAVSVSNACYAVEQVVEALKAEEAAEAIYGSPKAPDEGEQQ